MNEVRFDCHFRRDLRDRVYTRKECKMRHLAIVLCPEKPGRKPAGVCLQIHNLELIDVLRVMCDLEITKWFAWNGKDLIVFTRVVS